MNKIDITSSVLEKGLDTAKSFIDKLIMPSVEEVGLLAKDRVTLWRFNNQIKILNKAKEICEKKSINPKMISLKLLCPYLDYAGLEEDEVLQDKWAILLANMVDSKQNIENHVFPYLLSQISRDEFLNIEENVSKKEERVSCFQDELIKYDNNNFKSEQIINLKISNLDNEIQTRRINNLSNMNGGYKDIWSLQNEVMELQGELKKIEYNRNVLRRKIFEPEYLADNLEEYEIHNLIRLGIVKVMTKQSGYLENPEIKNEKESEYLNLGNLRIAIDIESEKYVLTELGDLFVKACTEQNKDFVRV